MTLEQGEKAPAFELKDQEGKTHRLSDYRGKRLVIYFYPKDDTPGCTKEACGFRDLHRDLEDRGVAVLGISKDNQASHKAFAEKYELPFPLLSDEDGSVLQAYGAWGEKSRYGHTSMGIIRSTVLVGTDGNILRHWPTVLKAEQHPADVLTALA